MFSKVVVLDQHFAYLLHRKCYYTPFTFSLQTACFVCGLWYIFLINLL